VILVTVESLAGADWPREAIDEIFYMPSLSVRDDVIKAISYLARTRAIDRIVPLDDYDVETAAVLREHLRIPGMGDTTARHFRDKLAMRVRARDRGLLVPEFVPVFNYDALREYMTRVPPPWLLKPRSEAAAVGIKKVTRPGDLWPILEGLGDRQSFYVLEHYIPGDIYHTDTIVSERDVVFAIPHRYGHPPMDVAHEGGIFSTRTIPRHGADGEALLSLNRQLIAALGLVRGVTHTEFIKAKDDGRWYFLETGARPGGAYIVETVEAATGINLWTEWAKIEIGGEDRPYALPAHSDRHAGVIVSLARQEYPDISAYNDPEVVWRLSKRHHAGLIVASDDARRVEELLEGYASRFREDFLAVMPLPDRPTA
jgi:hypothetical protein